MANVVNVSVGGNIIPVKAVAQNSIRVDSGSVNRPDKIHINPGSMVVVGKSPYIDMNTGNWMVYDEDRKEYVDSGVSASGLINSVSSEFDISEDGELSIRLDSIDISKLSPEIQEAISNISEAVYDVEEGSTNGTISVDGVDVPVHGLGTAAYTDSSEFERSGAIADAIDSLAAVAKTGNVNDLTQSIGDYLILDCGSSSAVI